MSNTRWNVGDRVVSSLEAVGIVGAIDGNKMTVRWGERATTEYELTEAPGLLHKLAPPIADAQGCDLGQKDYARKVAEHIARRHVIAYGESFERVKDDIATAIEDAIALGEQNAVFERRYGPDTYQEA